MVAQNRAVPNAVPIWLKRMQAIDAAIWCASDRSRV